MPEKIGSYDAKTRLPEILRQVESGKVFTITNHGKPIADLIPSRISHQQKAKTAISNILKAKKHKVSDGVMGHLKDSGRK